MVNYTIDKESDTPLYIQIRDVIQEAIRLGELHPGDRLPSVAGLAKEIGVTQATVRRALQDLSDAGQACCHVGRGTFIQNPNTAEASPGEFRDSHKPLATLGTNNPSAAHNPLEYAARRLRMGVGKALRDTLLKHRDTYDQVLAFHFAKHLEALNAGLGGCGCGCAH